MATKIQLRRGTSTEWTAVNPTLSSGEPGVETDTGKFKLGNGTDDWNTLPYANSGGVGHEQNTDTDLDPTFEATFEKVANKGAPNGYASLDSGGKVPSNQLISSLMEYKGTWDALTNTPALADGTGDAGDTYRVSVAGMQNLGSGNISFEVSDYIIYNSSIWEKSDTTDAVSSIFGRTGEVTAQQNDYSHSQLSGITETDHHDNSLDHDGAAQDTAIAGKEPANPNIQAHVTSPHAPSDAQKNSDITKAEIEAKLTGEISSHTHAGGTGDGVPSGIISMWSGLISAIPSGWILCDGQGGTPDLRDRFILSVGSSEDPGATGGSTSYGHSGGSVDSHGYITNLRTGGSAVGFDSTASASHNVTQPDNHEGVVPPYYKLAFIMKT